VLCVIGDDTDVDAAIERVRGLSAEECWAIVQSLAEREAGMSVESRLEERYRALLALAAANGISATAASELFIRCSLEARARRLARVNPTAR
jgi:hypothetical protein